MDARSAARFDGSNWIAGQPHAALSGASFARTRTERWPRSDAYDVRAARDAALAGAWRWSATPLAERRDAIEDGLRALAAAGEAIDLVASGLELPVQIVRAELDAATRAAIAAARGAPLDLERTRLATGRGPIAMRFDWTELLRGPMRELAFALARGRAVVVLADGRAPALANLFALAFGGLEGGAFACLHDDARTTLRAACEDSAFEVIRAATFDDEIDVDLGRAGARLLARPLRARSFVVRDEHSLEHDAAAVARAAFGRAEALSGVRAGAIGRVVAPAALFSRASELLLAAIDELDEARTPLPLALADADDAIERAIALAHDEGATVVEARSAAPDATFPALVTNVVPSMQTARATRPLPLLRLVRARDAADALRTAARLDREGPRETAAPA